MPKAPSDGPMPRMTIAFEAFPVMMNPAIMALSPVSTRRRVAMFKAWAGVAVAVAVGVALGVGLATDWAIGPEMLPAKLLSAPYSAVIGWLPAASDEV